MKEAPLLMILTTFQVAALSATSSGLSNSLPGCPDKCGDVPIPYPFGIGNGCAAASMNSFFLPSTARNRFTVIGCNTMGFIGGYTHGNPDPYVAGCYSYCQGINSTSNGAPCTGKGCCETTVPSNLIDFGAIFVINQSSVWTFNPCFYATR